MGAGIDYLTSLLNYAIYLRVIKDYKFLYNAILIEVIYKFIIFKNAFIIYIKVFNPKLINKLISFIIAIKGL